MLVEDVFSYLREYQQELNDRIYIGKYLFSCKES